MNSPSASVLAYKLVSVIKNDGIEYYYSAFGESVEYSLESWAKPRYENSKLFVFDTKENALAFISSHFDNEDLTRRRVKLFMCETEGLTKAGRISDTRYAIPEFWEGTICYEDTKAAPEGTLFADRVKLLEEVTIPKLDE